MDVLFSSNSNSIIIDKSAMRRQLKLWIDILCLLWNVSVFMPYGKYKSLLGLNNRVEGTNTLAYHLVITCNSGVD